ncbi:hypothetical protein LCGC14_1524580 [marine sediment metagenome]|uniref:HNH domain-containing protein n=1 Tax=marine sediment metagenome TaxID=412755 RepID=A0A0F9IXS2_9ZZZZ
MEGAVRAMNDNILEILQKLEAGVLQEKPVELKEFSNSIQIKARRTGISVRSNCGLCDINITICHHIKIYKKQRKYNGDESAGFVKIVGGIWICPNCHYKVHNRNPYFLAKPSRFHSPS